MREVDQAESRSIRRSFVIVSGFVGGLSGTAVVCLAHDMSPDPWGASRWAIMGVMVLAVVAAFVLVGVVLLWLLRLLFRDK